MNDLPPEDATQRFCTRLASAVSTLFADPDFRPLNECFRLLLTLHEWIGVLFSATAFGNADHVTRYLNPRGPADQQFLPGDRFIEKLCVLYSTESELELDFAALWAHDKTIAACLALVLLAPVFQGSAQRASASVRRCWNGCPASCSKSTIWTTCPRPCCTTPICSAAMPTRRGGMRSSGTSTCWCAASWTNWA